MLITASPTDGDDCELEARILGKEHEERFGFDRFPEQVRTLLELGNLGAEGIETE